MNTEQLRFIYVQSPSEACGTTALDFRSFYYSQTNKWPFLTCLCLSQGPIFNNKQINGVGVRLLPYVPPIYSMSLHLSINVATVKPKHSVFQYFVLYTRKRNILSNFKCNSLLEEEVVVVDDEDDSNADAMDVMLLLVVVGLDWFVR